MPRAIEIERLVEKIVARDPPEHVQHEAPFLIQMTIEKLDWRSVAIAYDRAAIAIGVLVEVAFAILADVPREFVGAKILLAPERFEVSREALVQPRVRPVAASQQVTPPLMREFVRDQRIAFEIEMCARVVQRIGGLRGRRSIFPPAKNGIRRRRVRVRSAMVGHPG